MPKPRPYVRRHHLPVLHLTEPIATCTCGGRLVTKRTIPDFDGVARLGKCNRCERLVQVIVEFQEVTEDSPQEE